jgi:hypothetical protein
MENFQMKWLFFCHTFLILAAQFGLNLAMSNPTNNGKIMVHKEISIFLYGISSLIAGLIACTRLVPNKPIQKGIITEKKEFVNIPSTFTQTQCSDGANESHCNGQICISS